MISQTFSAPTAERSVARVERKVHFGGDSQVDDRYAIIAPTRLEQSDPFILFAEDWFSSTGFEWHPHRGLETVTLVLDGVLEHGDNIGHSGALAAGDMQWMTAGRGIIHRELAFRNEGAHILQLWVNLPPEMKMVETRYQDLHAGRRPIAQTPGVRTEVISGNAHGVHGPALNNWPISAAMVTLEPNARVDHPLPAGDRAMLYVITGAVTIAGRNVREGEIAWSDPLPAAEASTIALQTGDGDGESKVIIYSGVPIRRPVAMGGPFVMNSRREIEQAFRDFHSGRFGPIPNQARLQFR